MGSELLSGFRMLDLADEKGALCGKIFADMGADVIKVEPPRGCSTRRIPPFVDDLPDAERSLYFIAYQAGKRSVTSDLLWINNKHVGRGADFPATRIRGLPSQSCAAS